MKDYAFLKLLDIFSPMFERSGTDYRKLRRIIQVELTMDSHRVTTAFANNDQSREDKNYFRKSLFIYAFLGLFTGIFMILPFPVFVKMNMTIGMIMFFLVTTLIADFSSVLLDIREKNNTAAKTGRSPNTQYGKNYTYNILHLNDNRSFCRPFSCNRNAEIRSSIFSDLFA